MPKIKRNVFGSVNTIHVEEFTLRGDESRNFEVTVSNFGATLVGVKCSDAETNTVRDLVMGFDNVDGYNSADNPHFGGGTCGRYANRIKGAKFDIDGTEYDLDANNGPNTLHGGAFPGTFDYQIWSVHDVDEKENKITFELESFDGDCGFPGDVTVRTTYQVKACSLIITHTATTDRATHVSLTNHTYWNLDGQGSHDVGDHVLHIGAEESLALDSDTCPTGEVVEVEGTFLDVRKETPLNLSFEEGGFDHNWCMKGWRDYPSAALGNSAGPTLMGTLTSPLSGLRLKVSSTLPGLQVYTGNHFDGSQIGKEGKAYVKHAGCALEPQFFPASPNFPAFPSTLLRPGEEYRSEMVFEVEEYPKGRQWGSDSASSTAGEGSDGGDAKSPPIILGM